METCHEENIPGSANIVIGSVETPEEIIEHLYDFDAEKFSNVVEVYVSALRKKLDPGPPHRLIHTVRGQGYLVGDMPE